MQIAYSSFSGKVQILNDQYSLPLFIDFILFKRLEKWIMNSQLHLSMSILNTYIYFYLKMKKMEEKTKSRKLPSPRPSFLLPLFQQRWQPPTCTCTCSFWLSKAVSGLSCDWAKVMRWHQGRCRPGASSPWGGPPSISLHSHMIDGPLKHLNSWMLLHPRRRRLLHTDCRVLTVTVQDILRSEDSSVHTSLIPCL